MRTLARRIISSTEPSNPVQTARAHFLTNSQRLRPSTGPGSTDVAAPGARFAHDFSAVSLRGGQPVQMQAELPVAAPGDVYEQEADRVAARVMQMPGPRSAASLERARSGMQLPGGEGVRLQARPARSGGPARTTAPPIVHQVLSSGGQPLEAGARGFMEPRFGHDFSQVRVHADAGAARSAESMGARAYTVGRDVVFGAGRYAPGTHAGDRLIAHELAHVVQQRATGARVQRETPAAAPVPDVDPELQLGQTLRGPGFAAGFPLAFYDSDEPEAKGRAEDFATRENAIGLKATGAVTAANLVVGKAISGVRDVETTVPAIAKVANNALARVPADPALPPASAVLPGKVSALAIFAHGTSDWCSLGITVSNAPRIFKTIAPNLSSTVRVILYTCSSGRGTDEEENWVKGTMGGGGKGSLASMVRDTLAEEKVEGGSVWGHTTVGHVSRNFALREFTVRAGKGAEGQSYVSAYIFGDAERTRAITDLADDINALGYAVAATDPAFITAATAQLESAFYGGYAEANKKLPGVNVAEDAPMYPYMTAHRVVTYWNDTYWPANRAAVAKKLIARMKLKKPKP